MFPGDELRPQYRVATRPLGNGNIRVVCDDDSQANVRRQKQDNLFSGQSGITAGNANLAVGDTITYQLDSAVSYAGTFTHTSTADFGQKTATLTANDVNTSVASRQKQFDQNIVIGEQYKIGSALYLRKQQLSLLLPPTLAINQSPQRSNVYASVMSPAPGVAGTVTPLVISIFRVARGAFVTSTPPKYWN